MIGEILQQALWRILAVTPALMIKVCVQTLVAKRLGDWTLFLDGRFSLNPRRHFDLIGFWMIMLLGFGWARPLHFNLRSFRHPSNDLILTALAGPLTNFILAFVSILLRDFLFVNNYFLVSLSPSLFEALLFFLQLFAHVNVILALLHLLPIGYLEGGLILLAVTDFNPKVSSWINEPFVVWGTILLLVMGIIPLQNLATRIIIGLSTLSPFLISY